MAKNSDWSRHEVEAIVADYLKMLSLELAGQLYKKSDHRRLLSQKLMDRSDASIEFKHGNISAVLIDLGYPYIKGYQPRSNYQALLRETVEAQLRVSSVIDDLAQIVVQLPAVTPWVEQFDSVEVAPPARKHSTGESPAREYQPVQRDYLARESRNESLGLAGEEFVVNFEHWRLNQLGHPRLADRVEHVSQTKGDGLGFDVLSFDVTGRERFIEVKTTAFGKDTPFFVTANELSRSRDSADQFRLCRLFEFRQAPRMFSLRGPLDSHCHLDPVSYRAFF